MKITRFAVKHPVIIAMILIALVLFGIYCILGISREFLPDISMPEVEVFTVYPGATAKEIEEEVTKILEDEFATLPNYKSMSSTSTDSISWISIVYQDGVDPYEQLNDLRYRIDRLNEDLPEDAQKPVSFVGGATMLPIMEFAIIGGNDTGRILNYISDTLKPKLTKIDGVSEINISGASDLQVNIKLRTDDLQSKNISVLQVYQVLNYSNLSVPLGMASYQGNNMDILLDGKITDLEEFKNLPVGANDNVIIRLKDVADVTLAYPKSETLVLSEGSNLIMVSVSKRASGNTVKINGEIKKVLEEISEDTDGALTYKIFADDSKSIKSSLSNVLSSGILGIIIAVVVIFLYLNNFRATIVIGLSIPLSFLFTFIAMRVSGNTINLMTTASFVVALGMIVDGSTVMIEQASRYLGRKNFTVDEAIFRGSDEVGASIVASVLTTVVVFLPICFLNGIMGMILNGFALILILCMVASLIVSIVVVPFLIKTIMGKSYKEPKKTWFMKMNDKLEGYYKKGLNWSLNHRAYVIILPVLLLSLSFMLIGGLGYSFIPSVDTGEFYISFEFPAGYMLSETEEKMRTASDIVREEVPENEGISVYIGSDTDLFSRFTSIPNHGYMYVMLKTGNRRNVQDIILDIQEKLSSLVPDAKVTVTNGGFDRLVGYVSDGGGYKLQLVGTDLNKLYESAVKIRNYLENNPNVVQTSIDTNFDKRLLSIKLDQENLSSLGITSYEAGMISGILFNGVDVGNFTDADGNRRNIHLNSDINENDIDPEVLSRMNVTTLSGNTVYFSDLANLSLDSTVSSIKHSERALAVTVGATLVSEDTSGVNRAVENFIRENPLPSGVETKNAGIMGLITDSLSNVITAAIIAIFLVFMVMVIQFENFKQPFIMFLSIPFCLIGVIVSLLIFNSSLTLMSAIAIISLAGIVVNNAIILVDYINQIRDKKRTSILLNVEEDLIDSPDSDYTSKTGKGKLLDYKSEYNILFKSIVEGGSSRLRPILMTTLTTLVGMLPMALAVGEGSELYASVGQAIAGGLLVSTNITLFIIPVMYLIFEKRNLKKALIKNANNENINNKQIEEEKDE